MIDSHLKLFHLILQAHSKSGIKRKLEKTCLFRSKVEYLGYEVSTTEIKLIPSYIGKVVNWLQPYTRRDLELFLGFLNYYSEFLPDFAKITVGLYAVKSKNIIE